MAEYRTAPMDRIALLAELDAICSSMNDSGISQLSLMFGWDSNQSIDTMWKPLTIHPQAVRAAVDNAEQSGRIEVGKADVLLDCEDCSFTMCHESDVHVEGESALVAQTLKRWLNSGFAPYEVVGANPSFQRTASPPLN